MQIIKLGMLILTLILIIGRASATNVAVAPSSKTVTKGQTFDLNVLIDPKGEAIAGAQLDIAFNNSILNVNSITVGNLFNQKGAIEFSNNGTINNSLGIATKIFSAIIGSSNVSTPGTFIIINATAISSMGTSGINLSNIKISDPSGLAVAFNVTNGSVAINTLTQIMSPIAYPAVIMNDNGRARPPGANITRLNVTVTGNIRNVTIDLSPVGGSATVPMTKISGKDIYTITTDATSGINLTSNLFVNATDTSGNFNNSVGMPVTVLLRGDIVRDNKIDLKDLLYMRRYIAGLEPSINILVADIQPSEGDGKVDLKDLLYLRRYLAGLEPFI